MTTLPFSEKFLTVQGEGREALKPTLFVRIAGCNLAEEHGGCRWCDTDYAQFKEQGIPRDVDELVQDIASEMLDGYPDQIAITGGEPLGHEGIVEFLNKLAATTGAWVSVETNGSIKIPSRRPENGTVPVSYKVLWNVDIKCPSSGMAEYNRLENLVDLNMGDQVKFVIADREDYAYALDVLHSVERLYPEVIFQPAFGILDGATLVDWILKDRLNVRLSLQAHKILWDPNRRGV